MLRRLRHEVHIVHPGSSGDAHVRVVAWIPADTDLHTVDVGTSDPGLLHFGPRIRAMNLPRIDHRGFVGFNRAKQKVDTVLRGDIRRLDPPGKTIGSAGLDHCEGTSSLQIWVVFPVKREPQGLVPGEFLTLIEADTHTLYDWLKVPGEVISIDTGFKTRIPDYRTRGLQ